MISMRMDEVYRKTKETEVTAKVNLDGEGKAEVSTGIAFFDHLLTSFRDAQPHRRDRQGEG